jgi:SPP1 family predicted phage head-tail adaptor
LNAGLLDRSIVIQTRADTRDANGGITTTWSTFATVWARRADQGGREFRSAGILNAEITTLWTIRYIDGLTAKHRITYGSGVWDILSIGELGNRRQYLQLATKAAV